MKRTISALLSLVIILSMTMSLGLVAKATQSRYYNFNKSYTLTGNYRNDIVIVANAQIGKNKLDLGYTENWCANFVCDCAYLTGIPNFPITGGVENLKSALVSWGGVWHSYSSNYSPTKGDIVFLSTSSNYYSARTSSHVGIVAENGFDSSGRVRTVEGNTSPSINGYNSVKDKNRKLMPSYNDGSDSMYVVGYIELKYPSTPTPSPSPTPTPTPQPTIKDCKWYVTIPSNYKLLLYDNYGTASNTYSHWISAKSTAYRVSCDRKVIHSDGSVQYRFTTGDGYTVYFYYTSSMSVEEKHTFDNNCDTTCNSCGATRSITHNYHTHYEADHPHRVYKKCIICGTWSYTGGTTTVASCLSCYPKPGASILTASKTSIYTGQSVKFTWTPSSNTTSYNLKYMMSDKYYEVLVGLTKTECSCTINASGVYYFYIDSVNNNGYTPSNFIEITVVNSDGTFEPKPDIPSLPELNPQPELDLCKVLGHNYTNACDNTCNRCNYTRVTTHTYDDYVYNNDASEKADGTKTRTCSVCGHKDTVTATGTKWKASFTDIKAKDFYYKPTLWAVANNITTGTSKTTFSPEEPCTRGQVVTFLWRAAGCPEPKSNTMPFTDVDSKAFYRKAVLWAVEQGITSGTSATTFSPNETCTRGQIATFLWRAKSKPAPKSSNMPFVDVAKKDFYYKAVQWAVENKITSGTSKTTFAPTDSCTRGQIVTFLYRAYN